MRARVLVLALLTVALPSRAQEVDTAGVIEEVAEEVSEVVDDTPESPALFNAISVTPRKADDGQLFYQRRSTEAFVDADTPLALEPKYYYELDATAPSAIRGRPAPLKLVSLPEDAAPGVALPLEIPAGGVSAEGHEFAWLDYVSPSPKSLVLFLRGEPTTLLIVQARTEAGSTTANRLVGRREFAAEETPPAGQGPWLDVWDRPATLGPRAAFLGRVVALARRDATRWAVDFFGEKLHPDSDCRLLLTPADHAWGSPASIRFTSVRIERESKARTPLDVLAVDYRAADGQTRRQGFDYPLCSSPVLTQMRQLARGSAGRPGGNVVADAQKTLGEELVEELECRLVNAKYR